MESGKTVVGIDFGTATTLVTQRVPGGYAEVVPIGRTTPWMPSVLTARSDGTLAFGEEAELAGEQFLLRSIKQWITNDGEPQGLPLLGGEHDARSRADSLIVKLLQQVKERAELAGVPSRDVVYRFACPAIWDGPRRQRLARLATRAGMPVSVADIIDEPIAAGLSWIDSKSDLDRPEGRTLVFDYGGGTLDIALLEVTESPSGIPVPELSVLSARGVAEAGDALDRTIAGDLARSLAQAGHPVEKQHDPSLLNALLLTRARRLKELLSTSIQPALQIPIGADYSRLMLSYSRTELEAAFRPQLERAFEEVRAALCEAWLRKRYAPSIDALSRMTLSELAKDVHYVLLAGGMAQIPMIAAWFKERIPQAEIGYDDSVTAPQESVASGLCVDFEDYHRINLPRPGFDLTLEWTENDGSKRQHVLYPAFTPLYTKDQVFRRESLSYQFNDEVKGLGRDTTAKLRAVSVDGEEMDFVLDRTTMPALPMPLQRHQRFTFTLKVTGEITVKDGTGRISRFRVDRWPVLRSGTRGTVTLSTVTAEGLPKPDPSSFTDNYSHPWF